MSGKPEKLDMPYKLRVNMESPALKGYYKLISCTNVLLVYERNRVKLFNFFSKDNFFRAITDTPIRQELTDKVLH